MGIEWTAALVWQAISTGASMAYQFAQQKKMKKKQAAAAEARKGFEFTTTGEAATLPVTYGKNIIGGVAVKHHVTSDYTTGSLGAAKHFQEAFDYSTSKAGTKNEYLHVQYAICRDGIGGVKGLQVNQVSHDDVESKYQHSVRTYTDGGTADAIATANGITATNTFTGTAFASATFKLDRNEPQYNGAPNMGFILEGRKVRAVELNTGVYSLATSYVYSNNPALCLLDYLLNADFGRGITVDELDLKSFYDAAAICGTVVTSGRSVGGVVNSTELTGVFDPSRQYPQLTGLLDLEASTGSTTITGIGTAFTTELSVGTEFKAGGRSIGGDNGIYTVVSITNDTTMEIDQSIGYVSAGKGYYAGIYNSPFWEQRPADEMWGTNTLFTSELVVGDEIFVSGETREVSTIVSDTVLTVTAPFTATKLDYSAEKISATRDIQLYECNLTLDTEKTVRDNIESIMSTMGMAELTWTSEGKYKLLVEYPTSDVELDALVNANHYFTEDDIIRDEITLIWPSASERYNQFTVSFLNEHEDFKSDSVTWPKSLSTAHTTYLNEDSNQPFIGSTTSDGVTDPYHAMATAEQMVRMSRSLVTLTMTVSKKGLSLEPGDFINVTAPNSGISDEVYRVQAIEVGADFTVKLSCYLFDYTALAWNTNDDIAYTARPTYDFNVEPVSNLTYTGGHVHSDHTAIAELTWTAPTDGSFKSIVYYTDGSGDLVVLGETSNTSFLIYPQDGWTDGQDVTFTVKAQTPFGRLSDGVYVETYVGNTPLAPTTFGFVESLYQTNNAAGVKARAVLSWTQPSGVEPKDWRVEYYRDEDGSTYSLLGYTPAPEFTYKDVRAGNYHFRITPISWADDEGTALVGTAQVLGLSATPADPTGFEGRVQQTGIILSWDKATDLDVLFGGHTQIRFTKDTGSLPNWPDAQVLVNQVDGNATSKSVPLTAGYFLIKHFDSTGNESAQAMSFLNTHQGATFTQVDSAEEATTFTGTKTNCAVVDGTLAMDAGFAVLQYQFANTVDLGEVTEVSLSPSFVASSYDLTLVSSYADISALTSFAGVANNGSVSFEVRHTDDDPTGTPTWSAWEPLIGGFFNNRAFQIRVNATVTDTGFTVRFSSIAVSVEKEDLTKSGTSTSSASADTTVTYASAFYGGTAGTTTPRLGVAIIGGSYGDTVVIVSRTKSAFDYSVYNSAGARIAIDVDWQAIGQ